MKGTLFSADFVKDSSDNLRLLELNTDTTISTNNIPLLDYSDFISVLQDNNISRVTVVHKPDVHKKLVADLSSSLNISASFITSFTEIKEAATTIYPTAVDDASDLFVLRLAYDESAIFDSEYAKGTINTLKLYNDYNSGSLVSEFYHSSSAEGVYNTITENFNESNVPDCVIKDVTELDHSYLKFYKIGSESELDTSSSRWQSFLSSSANESNLVQKYHISSEAITNNKVNSIRTYSIIYGSNLDLVHIGQFKQDAPFELPTISLYDESQYVNNIDAKHYYEFATNIPKLSSTLDGILSTHVVYKGDGTPIELGNVEVGDTLMSYYISGAGILTDDDNNYTEWQSQGKTLPSGSYLTSSVVIYKNSREVTDKTLTRLTIQNNVDSLYVATNKSFLVYNSGSDITSWKVALDLIPGNDYLLDYDGSIAEITENETLIINEDGFSLVEIDVEDTDTYIISGSTDVNSYVVHNAPCFVAGTNITLEDGTHKVIEEVTEEDIVLTYNHTTDELESSEVRIIHSRKVDSTVEYKFDNGTTLQATLDHPLYVNGKGWCSYSSNLSNKMYKLQEKVNDIQIGDEVKLTEGYTTLTLVTVIDEPTTVYNLHEVEKNHNFFANNILVHNRKA